MIISTPFLFLSNLKDLEYPSIWNRETGNVLSNYNIKHSYYKRFYVIKFVWKRINVKKTNPSFLKHGIAVCSFMGILARPQNRIFRNFIGTIF